MPLPFICIRRIETGHERVYVSILLAFFIHIVAALFLYVFFIKPYSGCMAIESLWVRVDVVGDDSLSVSSFIIFFTGTSLSFLWSDGTMVIMTNNLHLLLNFWRNGITAEKNRYPPNRARVSSNRKKKKRKMEFEIGSSAKLIYNLKPPFLKSDPNSYFLELPNRQSATLLSWRKEGTGPESKRPTIRHRGSLSHAAKLHYTFKYQELFYHTG